jgi:hypothetical protein
MCPFGVASRNCIGDFLPRVEMQLLKNAGELPLRIADAGSTE